MHTILRSLIENYANHSHKPGEALLLHGVYSWHSGKGIDDRKYLGRLLLCRSSGTVFERLEGMVVKYRFLFMGGKER